MGQYFFILLRSTRSTALLNAITINTPNILKRLQWSMIASFLAVLSFSTAALAIDYTFTWDANNEPNVAGYKIYYSVEWPGPPYDGLHPFYPHSDSPIDVGNVTEYTLHDLEEDVVYYFVVTAYDSEGYESGYSNQISTADTDNLDEYAYETNPDEFRSVRSGDSGADATGCFIQSGLGR